MALYLACLIVLTASIWVGRTRGVSELMSLFLEAEAQALPQAV